MQKTCYQQQMFNLICDVLLDTRLRACYIKVLKRLKHCFETLKSKLAEQYLNARLISENITENVFNMAYILKIKFYNPNKYAARPTYSSWCSYKNCRVNS